MRQKAKLFPRETVRGHRTAISRAKGRPGAPLVWLASQGLLKGRMLDFGCGKGEAARYYHMDCYDPYHAPNFNFDAAWGTYDTITCNYVLNVVDEQTQDKILQTIRKLLAPGGIAYISVRRDIAKEGQQGAGTWQRWVELSYPSTRRVTGSYEIYQMKKRNVRRNPRTPKDWRELAPHADEALVCTLQDMCEHELVEADDPWEGLKMLAWDAGYQNAKLQPWVYRLAKELNVDVDAEWQNGRETKGNPPRRRRNPFEDEGFTRGGFWGSAGSGILYVWAADTPDPIVLLLERSADVQDPFVWGIPGGAVPRDPYTGERMDKYESALKETAEELGALPPGGDSFPYDEYVFHAPGGSGFTFTTYLVDLSQAISMDDLGTYEPMLNWENTDYEWYPVDVALNEVDLHPGVRLVLDEKF